MEVIIKRAAGGIKSSEYPSECIRNVHWDSISGGVYKHHKGYSLYGYIPYEEGRNLVDSSGRHDFGYNDMKIKICPAKRGSPYYEAYRELVAAAGLKPKAESKTYGMPCTNRILRGIEGRNISRRELLMTLLPEGYPRKTISRAIRYLINQKRIVVNRAGNSYGQIIKARKEIA